MSPPTTSDAITPPDDQNTAHNRSVSHSSTERRTVSGGGGLDTVQAAAQVVAEHLPAGFTAEFDPGNTEPEPSATSTPGSTLSKNGRPSASSSHSASSANYGATKTTTELPSPGQEEVESSLKLQGGDIHRELFRIAAEAQAAGAHRRAYTFHTPRELQRQAEEGRLGLTVSDQLAPGGFRRAYILQQKQKNDFLSARLPITRNFVEFLDLYGSFAGEDLVDSDEEAISDGEEEEEQQEEEEGERRPLLRERTTEGRVVIVSKRSADAGTTKTFFTLLKAFVGTGIMFLPKAFNNGGILFSSVAMVLVSAITMVAFHLLLELKEKYVGGYGEIGHAVAGQKMRNLILGSIALSQLGFVCAGIVFVAENLLTFLEAITQGNSPLSTAGLIALQLVILVPLAWIRNISKLGPAALLADACILVGVTYIYWFDISTLVENGIHETVMLFNKDKYTMMIGSAIFTFEGIGLILPIQASMAQPEHFEWLLGVVMLIITVVFTSVGALCYATFGSGTQIEIINNFPQDSKLVNAIQFLYSVAILVGTPVQLFPALRILETKIFGHKSGKKSLKTKWIKNGFRLAIAVFCGVVSVLGAGNLDKFVALIGSSACVPLVYVYPAWLHYKGVANTRWAKIGDLTMVVLGLVGMIYTTTVTVVNSFM